MPKASSAHVHARREEIMSACRTLYETMQFKDISMKEIARATSFTRTSIYNYFSTKEEIFLAIYQQEYECWNVALEQLLQAAPMTAQDFARCLAQSVADRPLLLKLLSMNLYDMESESRPDRLASFKRAYGRSMALVGQCLQHHFPQADSHGFLYAFFPFMFGIYPYVMVTEKQRIAMEAAGICFQYHSIYEITYNQIVQLLHGTGA